MIDALKSRAAHALAHRDLAEILAAIPQGERDSPAHVASWLRAAASVAPGLADVPAFRVARGATENWRQGQEWADQASALWHSDAVRSEFSENEMRWVLENPRAAYKAMIADGYRVNDRDLRHEILLALAGAEAIATEHGLPFGDRPAASPIPGDVVAQDAEYRALLDKGYRARTSAEEHRLLLLAQNRADREAAELSRSAAQQQAPRRALDEGRLDPADAFADTAPAAQPDTGDSAGSVSDKTGEGAPDA